MAQSIEYSSLQNLSNHITYRSQISILYISFLFFFHWKVIYECAYKGLHKSTKNYSNFFIKVNIFIIFNLPIRINTIFSWMSIISFNDTGNVILQCILSEEDHLCFFSRRVISYLQKKRVPYSPNIQKISYFHTFFEKDPLSLSFYRIRSCFRE